MTSKPPKSWTRYVHRRLGRNQNFNCAITGPTGSGKSYAALAWALELDPSFDASRVVFTPKEFMDLVTRGALRPGSVILFDEIGVAMNSKRHMTAVNQALGFVFQTYRHRNLVVFLTTPHLAFLDSSVRRLLHAHAITRGIDYQARKARLKILSVEVDQDSGKVYKKYLRVKRGRQLLQLRRVLFDEPPATLASAYEARKSEFTNALNQRLRALVERSEEQELGKQKTVVLTDRQKAILDGIRAGASLTTIAGRLGLQQPDVSETKKQLEKKGYAFKMVRKTGEGTRFEVVATPGREVS